MSLHTGDLCTLHSNVSDYCASLSRWRWSVSCGEKCFITPHAMNQLLLVFFGIPRAVGGQHFGRVPLLLSNLAAVHERCKQGHPQHKMAEITLHSVRLLASKLRGSSSRRLDCFQ